MDSQLSAQNNCWIAQMNCDVIPARIGYCDSEEAATIYQEWRKEHWGSDASRLMAAIAPYSVSGLPVNSVARIDAISSCMIRFLFALGT